jgi:glycosyltransferase involved in cell wall biosynthesis
VKILHISSAKTFGGGERHLVDLCRELHRRGHEIFVALRPTNEWQEKLDFLPKGNIFHVSIRNSFGIFSAKKIARFVCEKNIEIVHAHVARDYIPASLVCRLAKGVKFVLTRHVLFPMKPFYRFTLGNLSRAIAVSKAVAKNLQTTFPREKIITISNGIEALILTAEERKKKREDFRFFHEIPFDTPLIGTIGELKVLKGQRDFVLAANEIGKKNPEARFLVIGTDHTLKKDFRLELKRMVKVFGLEEKFLFLDWVEDLPSVFAALDIFVSASHTESFGLVILEAMANATPIVASETEGAKELLRNDETGLLVPTKEVLQIAQAVEKLLNEEEKRIQIGKNAQTFAREKFSLSKMIDETESLYKEIATPVPERAVPIK